MHGWPEVEAEGHSLRVRISHPPKWCAKLARRLCKSDVSPRAVAAKNLQRRQADELSSRVHNSFIGHGECVHDC